MGKRTVSLPALRVREDLEVALMRLASQDQRTLSDYVRVVLERHCFGHVGAHGADDDDDGGDNRASHCDARSRGGRESRVRGGDR